MSDVIRVEEEVTLENITLRIKRLELLVGVDMETEDGGETYIPTNVPHNLTIDVEGVEFADGVDEEIINIDHVEGYLSDCAMEYFLETHEPDVPF